MQQVPHSRISSLSNQSKQIQETNTTYSAGTYAASATLLIGLVAPAISLNKSKKLTRLIAPAHMQQVPHSRISSPSNQSKQIQETNTAYSAGTYAASAT